MALQNSFDPAVQAKAANLSGVDAGLRSYMLRVFNYMGAGLGVTGLIAGYLAANPDIIMKMQTTGFNIIMIIAMVALPLVLSFRLQKLSVGSAQALYWGYAVIVGLALAPLALVYTGESIARTFFITAATFLGMSFYGYTTKKDLTSIGSFAYMGLWGLIIASLVNIFLQSSGLQFALSLMGVAIFTILTAWDVQRIKEVYVSGETGDTLTKKALMGALMLYLDFINLFISLLRFVGERR